MIETNSDNNEKKKPYLGDLEKTGRLMQLIETPEGKRNDEWRELFLSNLPQASFRCGKPQVLNGPDGFPYFELLFPEPNQAFECFVIEEMIGDFLISSGLGIVINDSDAQPIWVFSHGDLLNFHLNKVFYNTEKSLFNEATSGPIKLKKDKEVMLGQASKATLPKTTRELLKTVFENFGIQDAKVVLMMREDEQTKETKQDLVFNVTPESFEDPSLFDSLMRVISWYLPKHYTFLGMKEDVFKDSFKSL